MSSQKYRNAIAAGEKIGGYRIEKILGQGGFGITYLARDEKLDRYLAVKEYFPAEFSKREEDGTVFPHSEDAESAYAWGLERFLDEGKMLAKFKHPNIVRVVDYLEENNTAYIVMEYEHGNDLQTLLKEAKTLGCDATLKIFLPLMDGLSRVHAAGFIHRDIKPANIFIREDGSPVLIDFGSARQGLATRTKTLTTLVSPGYAPFEQYNADGMGKQGPWTDIYALGASMYKCLFGRSPLDALARAEARVAGRDDPYLTAMRLGGKHHPVPLLEAIDKAMAFLPNDRPQRIADWIKIIEAAADYGDSDEDDKETRRIGTTVVDDVVETPEEAISVNRLDDAGLKLAITKYIVFGMLTFWAYTSYALCGKLHQFASTTRGVKINANARYLFSGVYLLSLLLVLSWIVPNVFMGHVFGKAYILPFVLVSAALFYANTAAFVLWYMQKIKLLDELRLQEEMKYQNQGHIREAANAMITKWEGIDNHVILFLVVAVPMIFSPFACVKLFFTGISQALVPALPIIVMLLGGLFHVWGTRLLINTYNQTLIE